MTYFGFLIQFLVIPLFLLVGLTWWDRHHNIKLPVTFRNWPVGIVLGLHIIIAVVYTTPWDNYLVATRVWWYDPNLVTGIILGWVPLEEYTFFVLQTLFTGLWLAFLARRLPGENSNSGPVHHRLRLILPLIVGLIWLVAITILAVGWKPGTYLGLELAWALPPIMLQLAFGADILWYHRRLVLLALIPPTLYLSFVDMLAIGAGTWTIDPAQSLNIFLAGRLPVEEFIFFLLTNTLVTFGMVLALACQSQTRIPAMVKELTKSDCRLVKTT